MAALTARKGFLATATVAAMAVLGLGLYGIMAGGGNAQAEACAASVPVQERMRPLVTGEVAALQATARPRPMNELRFKAPDGTDRLLAAHQGRVVLLNLWATWCAPCRKEMPALDRLQAEFGGPDFEVVAISIDQRNLDRPGQFLDEIGVTRLTRYADPSAKVFQDLRGANRAIGMPTTILIDRNGCELGILHGPAEWASEDAFRLIRAALGR
jgi:thiol-disulfide isomerase/thioredoxin